MEHRILVVDDSHLNRVLLKDVLVEEFQQSIVYEAEDGIEALQFVKDKDIDVILLDLIMPNMDGFEVLENLKKNESTRDVPIIVNSTLDDINSIKKALGLGAYDYFTKPFNRDQLEIVLPIKIRNAFRTYDLIKELTLVNQKVSEELHFAKAYQKALVEDYKELGFAKMYGKFEPGANLEGSVYDCVSTDGAVWFIMADVDSKGITSAIVSLMIKALFNELVERMKTPADVLNQMNRTFCQLSSTGNTAVFSAFIGEIKNNTFTFASAGHIYPILFDTLQVETQIIENSGPLVGVFEETRFTNKGHHISKNSGIMLLNYTLSEKSKLGSVPFYSQHKADIFDKLSENPSQFIDWILEMDSKESGSQSTNPGRAAMLVMLQPEQ